MFDTIKVAHLPENDCWLKRGKSTTTILSDTALIGTNDTHLVGVAVAVGQKTQRLGPTSYYQQQMLLVTECEKAYYQRSRSDYTAYKDNYQRYSEGFIVDAYLSSASCFTLLTLIIGPSTTGTP